MKHPPTAIEAWIDQATKGLPKLLKRQIQDELHAHYADTLDELCADGNSAALAESLTLARMGNPGEIRKAFLRTHLAPRRYWLAVWVSLLSFLTLLMGAFLTSKLILILIPSIACTSFMVRTFAFVNDQVAHSDEAARAIRLLEFGLISFGLFSLWHSLSRPDTPTAFLLLDPMLMPTPGFQGQQITHYLLGGTTILIGIAWLMFSEQIIVKRQNGPLLALLRLSMTVSGLALMIGGTAFLLQHTDVLNAMMVISASTGIIRHAALGAFFFRSARIAATTDQMGLHS